MANYLKPQSPLQHKDGDYFYPLTTVDQVITDNDTRLSAELISVNLTDAVEGDTNMGINADTLDGHDSEYFATNNNLNNLNSRISALENNNNSLLTTLYQQNNETGFAGQTITINNLSSYRMILILTWSYSSVSWFDPIHGFFINDLTDGYALFGQGNSYRTFSIDGNNITFGDASDGSATNNAFLVPCAIYGVNL